MAYQLAPLHPIFAAEITGLDFSSGAGALPQRDLKTAIDQYGVVVYRNSKPLTDDQHVAFSALFGPVEVGPMFKIQGDKKRIDNPALVDVGNLDADGNIMKPDNRRMLFRKGDRLWHADMSFHPNRATYSLLLGHEIPPEGAGGDTSPSWGVSAGDGATVADGKSSGAGADAGADAGFVAGAVSGTDTGTRTPSPVESAPSAGV